MTVGERYRPAFDLVRHFLREFLYLRFLDDTGADSMRRTIITTLAGIFSLLIFFPRLVVARYIALSGQPTPGPYRLGVIAGQFTTVSLSMFVGALVAALVCQSAFPDEVDYRVLLALPLTRRLIFGTKALALAAFAGVFVAGAVFVLGVAFVLASGGRWAEASVAARLASHAVAVAGGCAFAATTVLAVQGAIVVALPRAWSRLASVASQTLMIGALILSLPLVARAGRAAAGFQNRQSALLMAPPAWFVGLEQVLLGRHDAYSVQLARAAGAGLGAAILVVAVCYLTIYGRFDRLGLRPTTTAPRLRVVRGCRSASRDDSRPVEAAVTTFINATLRRSGLHQVVFGSMAACGVAVAVNGLVGAAPLSWSDTIRHPTGGMLAITAAPLVLLLFGVFAVRQALVLPLEIRANWVFRLAGNGGLQRRQMRAFERALVTLALVPCLASTFPLQALVLGWTKAAAAGFLNALAGLLLIEIAARRWWRIPFTCSYVPGKRHLVHTLLLAFTMYVLVADAGGMLIIFSLRNRAVFAALAIALLAAVAGLRQFRIAACERMPLEFEDSLPDDVQLMPLSAK
jgi:hypothetical protein